MAKKRSLQSTPSLLRRALAAACLAAYLGAFPSAALWADDVLLGIYPAVSKPVGASNIQFTLGAGMRLDWRPVTWLDLYAAGDYRNLTMPAGVSAITLLNGALGVGYHVPFTDKLGLDVGAQMGAYRATRPGGSLTGISAGLSVALSYRINPVVSLTGAFGANHYAASPVPLMTDVQANPGVTLNLGAIFDHSTNLRIQVEDVQPVFPVLYSWYQKHRFASARVVNREDAEITDVSVSFYMPQYMSQPNLCGTAERLGRGEALEAGLTAFFNEQMLDLVEEADTAASVIVEYTYLGQHRRQEQPLTLAVFGRNSMNWEDDRRAAAFVSGRDPAAQLLAKYITSVVRENVRPGVSRNIQYAMGIFETLDAFGINYVIDPTSAYADNVGSMDIDFLQFPYQTLMYRGGDCDDLSILTCSLFEAVGIRTAFITIPGHIFMAFDSGMTMQEARANFLSPDELIDHGGEAWVPLEITLTDEGYNRAWRVGARQWNQAQAQGAAAIYIMEDSWRLYKPISVPGATARFTLPEEGRVAELFHASMDYWIAREISPVVAQYQARLAEHDDVQTRNELGILYGRYGLFAQAEEQLAAARAGGYLPALLNTANVRFARRQFVQALDLYSQVLEEDPENVLAMLGIARCQYELEDYDESDAYYEEVARLAPELAEEYRYLGMFEDTYGRSYSLADRLVNTKWSESVAAMAYVPSGSEKDGLLGLPGAAVGTARASAMQWPLDWDESEAMASLGTVPIEGQGELPGLVAEVRIPDIDLGGRVSERGPGTDDAALAAEGEALLAGMIAAQREQDDWLRQMALEESARSAPAAEPGAAAQAVSLVEAPGGAEASIAMGGAEFLALMGFAVAPPAVPVPVPAVPEPEAPALPPLSVAAAASAISAAAVAGVPAVMALIPPAAPPFSVAAAAGAITAAAAASLPAAAVLAPAAPRAGGGVRLVAEEVAAALAQDVAVVVAPALPGPGPRLRMVAVEVTAAMQGRGSVPGRARSAAGDGEVIEGEFVPEEDGR